MFTSQMLLASSGASALITPLELFQSGEHGLFYDTRTADYLFRDTARTNAVTADGQAILGINDSSGNGNYATGPGAEIATWNAAEKALDMDGVDAGLFSELTFNGSSYSAGFAIKTTADAAIVASRAASSAPWTASFQKNSTATLLQVQSSATFYVDGNLFTGTTRNDLHALIADGDWHYFEMRSGFDGSYSGQKLAFFRYTSYSTWGLDGLVGCPFFTTNASNLDAVRDFYAAEYGISMS